LLPILINNSSIPIPLKAEVMLKNAPILSANSFPSTSVTSSLSNKSLLFPASPITI